MKQKRKSHAYISVVLCLFIVGSLINIPTFAYSANILDQFMVLPVNNTMTNSDTKIASEGHLSVSETKKSSKKIKSIKVYIDNTLLDFPVEPVMVDDEVLVPMKTLFEAFGSQVIWINDSQEVIGYKNNMFIKLKIDSSTAYINGNPITLSTTPIIQDSRTMVPATFIAHAFDMSSSQEIVNDELILKFNTIDRNYIYKQVDGQYFKYVTNPDSGFSLYIPLAWNKLDEDNVRYGIDNEFQFINLSVIPLPLTKNLSIEELTQIYVHSLKMRNSNYEINGHTTININSMPASVIFYSQEIDDKHKFKEPIATNELLRTLDEDKIDKPLNDYYISYLFINDTTAYLIKGNYQAVESEETMIDTFNKIVNTFQINNITIDQEIEHYVEYTPFYKYHIHYDQPIFSNMQVYNTLPFSGSIDHDENLNGFEILVSKEDKSYYYYVPIIDGYFNADIPLPFGLGQHNIDISLDIESTMNTNQEIVTPVIEKIILDPSIQIQNSTTEEGTSFIDSDMNLLEQYVNEALINSKTLDSTKQVSQFSVINLSNDKTQYVLSTEYVNSNNPEIRLLSTSETYDQVNDYSKSKALYNWILKNITLNDVITKDELQDSVSVLKTRTGNPIEINFLYASLLRTINIEARIVEGQINEEKHYWTEVYLNGKWYVTDIFEDLSLAKKSTHDPHTTFTPTHFMTPVDEARKPYTDIIVLLF